MAEKNFDIKKLLFGTIVRKVFWASIVIAFLLALTDAYLLNNHLSIGYASYRQAVILAILFFVISIVSIFVSGLFIARSILSPLKQLRNATRELEKGNFDVKTDIHSGDELEELGSAFNKMADALSRMDEERKRIEKIKTEFLSITSHELRSPMTPIKGQLEILLEGYDGKLNKKQKDSLKIILRNTNRLDRIIQDFLEISRIEAARLKFNFKKTDLAKDVKLLAKEMNTYLPEKKIKIKTQIEKLPEIEADSARVMQVLRNLVNNAKKFSPEKSKITISAKPEKKYIQFSVKDEGIGISPDDQLKVFDPFYQAEKTMYRKYGGVGLGLSICKGIVESQGGKIWVESKLGEGSTFYFTLPLKPLKSMKPIKVLFSQRAEIEVRIKETFREFLGVLGESEFEDMSKRKKLTKEDLTEYIDFLVRLNIIEQEQGDEFRKKIISILQSEPSFEKMNEAVKGK